MESDVMLNVILRHEGETILPQLIDNLSATLISGLGKQTALEASVQADFIVVSIPWVEGRLPGCHSLKISGSINGLAWACVGKSLIKYTSGTEPGASKVTVEGDTYDVTMEVGYHYTDSPIDKVMVQVDGETGEPRAEATYINKNLGIYLYGLKGETGETGTKGETGKTGPQGASAVFDPQTGNVLATLENTLGCKDINAMTQKAVTNELIAEYGQTISATTLNYLTIDIDGNSCTVESDSSQWMRVRYIPVSAGELYKVGYVDPASAGTRYCHIVLLPSIPALNVTGTVIETKPTMATPTSESFNVYVPADGYLCVFYRTQGSNGVSISFAKASTLREKIVSLSDDIEDIKSKTESETAIDAWTTGSRMRYVKSSSATTTAPIIDPQTGYKRSGMISVSQGDTVTVSGVTATNTCVIAFAETDSTSALRQKRGASAAVENATFSWVVTSDGYVMVSGGIASTAVISKADAFASKSDISKLEESLEDLLANDVPEYWKTYLAEREATINADAELASTEIFAYITDVHWIENRGISASLIRHLIKNSVVCKTVCGGDVCSTANPGSGSFENLFMKEIRAQDRLSEAAKEQGKFYAIHGNHDFFEKYGTQGAYRLPYKKAAAHIKSLIDTLDINLADDENGVYYYVDNPESGIRTIYIDTHCGSTTGHLRMSAAQLRWLASCISESANDVVVIGHTPATPRFATSSESAADNFSVLRHIILAANKRETGTIAYQSQDGAGDPDAGAEISYDFGAWNKTILLYINGHNHCDNQTYHDGIPFVTVMCDKADHHGFSPFCEGLPQNTSETKPAKTTSEQAFDVVSIPPAHDKIVFRRIGLGYDRTFHAGEIKMSVGGTATLEPGISAASWTSSDCAVGQVSGSTWPYVSDIVSVEDGVVTALAPGEAFVFAEDAGHNKEFWAITVE